ncbi:hypothetical protein Pmani_028771 [Petrolisthes manimaculis]|uniref:Uncharacterized protein n=1 Tax=Petrolisthes manimaculis TaxID=1843537 RepID=A0AAE1P021_9EUCA|nr:hypothetical protein Pmani_028771 [Petrolisthes manimaculis]
MASGFPGLFVEPTLNLRTSIGAGLNTDNDGDGEETSRLYPYASIDIIIILSTLFGQYDLGRSFVDDQSAIYHLLEERITNTYGLDGKKCIYRFICELTKNPIKDYTLMGELITTVFSPRKDNDNNNNNILKEYLEAQLAGEVDNPESCHIAYGNECPVTLINDYYNNINNNDDDDNNELHLHPPEFRISNQYHTGSDFNRIQKRSENVDDISSSSPA